MKFSLLAHGPALREVTTKGATAPLVRLAELMVKAGLTGNIFELPIQEREKTQASPFSITSGFALHPSDLAIEKIPELKKSPEDLKVIGLLLATYNKTFSESKKINFQFQTTLVHFALESAYPNFDPQGKRKKSYESFIKQSNYWLEDYCLFQVLKETNKKIPKSLKLTPAQEKRKEFFAYVQFLCWEQRVEIHKKLQGLKIGLVLNLPFGVEPASPDVIFNEDVFDQTMQVGCSPEPEHGYPEQAWGITPYIEKSEALRKYLLARFDWLSQLGDGLFLDHLVGWCGQYVLPETLPAEAGPHGHFLTENQEERIENILWLFDCFKGKDLNLSAEIAGDHNRLHATLEGLEQGRKEGLAMSVMEIPRWKRNEEGKIKSLGQYQPESLMMLETHDTTTLLQYLTNKKGDQEDFESGETIAQFCQMFLGWPIFAAQAPIQLAALNCEVTWELFRRIYHGSKAEELVFTYGGLVSLLHPEFFTVSVENNINVAAGTTGEVGNLKGNWSFYSPPLSAFADLVPKLNALGPRQELPIAPVQSTAAAEGKPELLFSDLENKQVIFFYEGKYQLFKPKSKEQSPSFELLLHNPHDYEIGGMADLAVFDLPSKGAVLVTDLNATGKSYQHELKKINQEGLFYQMMPGQKHHLIFTFVEG